MRKQSKERMPSLGGPLSNSRKLSDRETGRSHSPSKENSIARNTIRSSCKKNSSRDDEDTRTRPTPPKGSSKLPKLSHKH
jgi:hypothetical protein